VLHVGRGGERGGRALPHDPAARDDDVAVGDAPQRADDPPWPARDAEDELLLRSCRTWGD
jgi:hypothetical protein